MSFAELRRRAAVVRATPLESVLLLRGAVRDGRDRCKWHTERGPLSVTGPQFMNWQTCQGGGGAIDLVMHLAGGDFRAALAWLEEHLAAAPASRPLLRSGARPVGGGGAGASGRESSPSETAGGWLPARDDRWLDRVRRYLTTRRRLAGPLIEPLIDCSRLYADNRGNAVFVMVAGKARRPVGAELRGTGPRQWRGMARGTRKDLGYFWIGASGSGYIVLCESAIDAISCFQIHPQWICISTSGIRADPPWLAGLLARGYGLYCGFDADVPGDAAAERMIALHPTVKRLRPSAHDWNDVLASVR